MNSLIDQNLEAITRLCRENQVCRLTAFGSIVRDDFDTQLSDADFLVEFETVPAKARMQHYFALRLALSTLLGRSVDLIEVGAIRNPYVLKSVTEQRKILYAA